MGTFVAYQRAIALPYIWPKAAQRARHVYPGAAILAKRGPQFLDRADGLKGVGERVQVMSLGGAIRLGEVLECGKRRRDQRQEPQLVQLAQGR